MDLVPSEQNFAMTEEPNHVFSVGTQEQPKCNPKFPKCPGHLNVSWALSAPNQLLSPNGPTVAQKQPQPIRTYIKDVVKFCQKPGNEHLIQAGWPQIRCVTGR